MTTATIKIPARFDLMLHSNGKMLRFDSGITVDDALMTLRAHDIVGAEQGEPPLDAEIWAVYADGSTERVEGI